MYVCLSAGLSARTKALYSQVRPCSVVLRRLRTVSGPGSAARRHRHPPAATLRVLLPRLTEAEIAAWLTGGGLTPPVTPPGGPSDHHRTAPSVPHRRRHDRQNLLRDECKTIRDEHFFHLLHCDGRMTRGDGRMTRGDGRVTRGDHKVSRLESRPPLAAGSRRPRSKSEGDSLVRAGDEVPRLDADSPYRRRMSLLGSMQGRLHSGTKSGDSHISRPLTESDLTSAGGGVTPDRDAVWTGSPRPEPSPYPEQTGPGAAVVSSELERTADSWSPGVLKRPQDRQTTPFYASGTPSRQRPVGATAAAAGERGRRLPLAVGHLMSDECKTLRDREFVQLLNRPSRTTRSAASESPGSERRRRPVSVWLHWPGFAREPEHQTPVKHARAAGQPRVDRVPVVRLERLFRRLDQPAMSGGGPSEGRLSLLSTGGGGEDGTGARCRRRLRLDGPTDAELTARFVSRFRQHLLPDPPPPAREDSDGDGEKRPDEVAGAQEAAPPSAAPSAGAYCDKRTPDSSCSAGPLKRLRDRPRKALSESGTPEGRGSPIVPLDSVDNNNLVDSVCDLLKHPRGQTRKTVSESGTPKRRGSLVLDCVHDPLRRLRNRPRKAASESGTPKRRGSLIPQLDSVDSSNLDSFHGLLKRPCIRLRKVTPEPGTPKRRGSLAPQLDTVDNNNLDSVHYSLKRLRDWPRKTLSESGTPKRRGSPIPPLDVVDNNLDSAHDSLKRLRDRPRKAASESGTPKQRGSPIPPLVTVEKSQDSVQESDVWLSGLRCVVELESCVSGVLAARPQCRPRKALSEIGLCRQSWSTGALRDTAGNGQTEDLLPSGGGLNQRGPRP